MKLIPHVLNINLSGLNRLLLPAVVAVLGATLVNPAAAQEAAAKPGDLLWSISSKAGSYLYSIAAGEDAVYAIGDAARNANGDVGGGRIEKRSHEDGSLIWGIDVAGVQEILHADIHDDALYVAAQPWQVQKRRLSDGELIYAAKSEAGGKPYHTVVDDTGVYISGIGFGKSPGWRVEKRSLEDGSVIWTQGRDVNGVALSSDADGEFFYAGGYLPGEGENHLWHVERRNAKDGELVWEHTVKYAAGRNLIYGVSVVGDALYLAGFDTTHDHAQWRVEKRDLAKGSVIWQTTNNPSDGMDKAHGLDADDTGLYISGYDDKGFRFEKHSLEDGSVVWSANSTPGGRMWYAVDIFKDAVYGGGQVSGGWVIEKRVK